MDCSICLSDLKVESQYKTICNHIFCNLCIAQWKKYNITCPLCRTQIQPLEYIPHMMQYISGISSIFKKYMKQIDRKP